jgi:hypothetical protein
MKKESRTMLSASVLTCFSLIWCTACGGGTSGTGDLSPGVKTVDVIGQIVDSTTTLPVAQVTVTLAQTGDTAISNQVGEFAIQVPTSIERPQLFFDSPSVEGAVTLQVIPEEASSVRLVIELNPADASVTLTSIDVQVSPPTGAPTPVPSPTPGTAPPALTPATSPTQDFRGRILLRGKTLPGAVIRIDSLPERERSDDSGRFQFAVSPPRKSLGLRLRVPNLVGELHVRLAGLPTPSTGSALISFTLDIVPRTPRPGSVGTASNDSRNFVVTVRR